MPKFQKWWDEPVSLIYPLQLAAVAVACDRDQDHLTSSALSPCSAKAWGAPVQS